MLVPKSTTSFGSYYRIGADVSREDSVLITFSVEDRLRDSPVHFLGSQCPRSHIATGKGQSIESSSSDDEVPLSGARGSSSNVLRALFGPAPGRRSLHVCRPPRLRGREDIAQQSETKIIR